jgi:hypothetical protein
MQQQQQAAPSTNWQAQAASAFMTGNSNSEAMLDIGMSAGAAFAASSMSRFVPGAEGLYGSLKYYFAVNNTYVQKKFICLMAPFLTKDWKRVVGNDGLPAPPAVDTNAPDLYIPTMALITYVLLSGVLYGNSGEFTPEIIQDLAMYCLLTQTLEIAGIRFGYYVMQAPIAWLDLAAYTGYKYLGLCLNMLVGISFGYTIYNICLLYTGSVITFFTLKTFANNIPRNTAADGPKREFMVLGFAASQFLTMWWLGNTKHLA